MAITTTKALVAQSPLYAQDEAGNLTVARYIDAAEYPFTTQEDRQALAPECKQTARKVGGRTIVRTTTVDDKDTPLETDNDITIAEKVIDVRETADVTLTIGRAQAFVLVNRLGSIGEKWADNLAATVTAALA